jgi:hypothetical protein
MKLPMGTGIRSIDNDSSKIIPQVAHGKTYIAYREMQLDRVDVVFRIYCGDRQCRLGHTEPLREQRCE